MKVTMKAIVALFLAATPAFAQWTTNDALRPSSRVVTNEQDLVALAAIAALPVSSNAVTYVMVTNIASTTAGQTNAAHVAATDPHGDRASAAGLYAPIAQGISGTNAQARVAVVETNTVTKGMTNGWVVAPHTGLYPNTNPSNFVDRTVTNGLQPGGVYLTPPDTNGWVVSAHGTFYTRDNPSNYVNNAQATNIARIVAGETNAAHIIAVDPHGDRGYADGLIPPLYPRSNPSNYVDKTVTNGLQPSGSYYLNSNPSNFVDRTVTNGLQPAGSYLIPADTNNFVVSSHDTFYTRSNPSNYVNRAEATNGMATSTDIAANNAIERANMASTIQASNVVERTYELNIAQTTAGATGAVVQAAAILSATNTAWGYVVAYSNAVSNVVAQALLVDGTRSMAGNIEMGGNSITNLRNIVGGYAGEAPNNGGVLYLGRTVWDATKIGAGSFGIQLADQGTVGASSYGFMQCMENTGTLTMGNDATGYEQWGYNAGVVAAGSSSYGMSQRGNNGGSGSVTMGDFVHGGFQRFDAPAGSSGTISMGNSCGGSGQFVKSLGAATITLNNTGGGNGGGSLQVGLAAGAGTMTLSGDGSLQVCRLANGQTATVSGHGSAGVGSCVVSNDNCLVVGDGAASSGNGTITVANGYYGSGASLTGITAAQVGATATNTVVGLIQASNVVERASAAGLYTTIVTNNQPAQAFTGYVTSDAGGTCTVVYASGPLVEIIATTNTTIHFGTTGYPTTGGVLRVAIELWSGTNAISFNTSSITNPTAMTLNTNAWNSLFFRRNASSTLWTGRQ